MVEIRVRRTIAAPVEQVFDWLADPVQFGLPLRWLSRPVTRRAPPCLGGRDAPSDRVGTWFREEITAYDRPRSYSYLIVRSGAPFHSRTVAR